MHIFNSAKQVFIKNKRETVNFTAGFKCKFDAAKNKEYKLKITGATLYSVYLNGEFVFYGPARAPHGYIRYDEVPLKVNIGENILCVVVAGYNCPSFYTMNIKSFLQAEILENGNAIKYTGRDFSAVSLDSVRETKAFRYSFQRAFNEVWNFDNSSLPGSWMTEDFAAEPLNEYHLDLECIPRGFENPEFNTVPFGDAKSHGRFRRKDDFKNYDKRHITGLDCKIIGYKRNEIKSDIMAAIHGVYFEDKLCDMTDNRYSFYDLGRIDSGFIRADITAKEDSEVYFVFSETLAENGQPDSGIYSECTQNVIRYNLKKSDKPYKLQSFEVYSFRYLTILVCRGSIEAKNVSVCEYVYPISDNTHFECADGKLSLIAEAARQTFIQNTIDCYMDCPGRERAGWLCDSFFTAQAAQIFEGGGKTEELFLKNFIMAKDIPGIDSRLLPMCYPGDNNGVIMQWIMWYVLELRDYLKRKADDAEYFRGFVYGFLEYLAEFECGFGLLKNLNGWNFIEWSDANEFVSESDISYPTNMLYAAVLDAAAEIYSDLSLSAKADNIRTAVVQMSFDGELFCDGALLKNGSYVNLPSTSEACQYYAIFSGTAAKGDSRFDKFFDTVINTFGYAKKKRNYRPEVAHAAVFIGYSIRMLCLNMLGENEKLLDEIKELYAPMAEQTLTLWEHDAPIASLNHGLSSVAAPLIIKALTGIGEINERDKVITVANGGVNVPYNISIGLEDGKIEVSNDGNKRQLRVSGIYRIEEKFQR